MKSWESSDTIQARRAMQTAIKHMENIWNLALKSFLQMLTSIQEKTEKRTGAVSTSTPSTTTSQQILLNTLTAQTDRFALSRLSFRVY